jgi:hypothetical protein
MQNNSSLEMDVAVIHVYDFSFVKAPLLSGSSAFKFIISYAGF